MDDTVQPETETVQQPVIIEAEQEVVKSSSSGLNKNLLRCLLLVLPVAIPVVIYLRDVAPTRRIFLTTFVLLLVVVFSCMLMALLRAHRRHLEDAMSDSEITRELAQHHILSMTNRFLPRRSACGTHEIHSYTHTPVHYHLAPHYHSRSPSPQVPHSPVSLDSPLSRSPSCRQHSRSPSLRQPSRSSSVRQHSSRSPLHRNSRSPSPYRTRRSFRRHSSSSPPRRVQSTSRLPRSPSPYRAALSPASYVDQLTPPVVHPGRSRSLFFSVHVNSTQVHVQPPTRDDPPPYEVALGCPLATVRSPREGACNPQAETPPPSYDKVLN
ncbi:uncharacterized protein LOC111087279 [Limulus polyphemus]|uniref:Uncharacterized protein LOC111087279 n=1 Tax=Limulus polyphemus TaxID=6850 RepID=A0ABM1SZN3_LIMPO|nr:uncharacterized protein LOC111087279 [Limulus polyphemus]